MVCRNIHCIHVFFLQAINHIQMLTHILLFVLSSFLLLHFGDFYLLYWFCISTWPINSFFIYLFYDFILIQSLTYTFPIFLMHCLLTFISFYIHSWPYLFLFYYSHFLTNSFPLQSFNFYGSYNIPSHTFIEVVEKLGIFRNVNLTLNNK